MMSHAHLCFPDLSHCHCCSWICQHTLIHIRQDKYSACSLSPGALMGQESENDPAQIGLWPGRNKPMLAHWGCDRPDLTESRVFRINVCLF